MLLKVLAIVFIFFRASSAGGEESCDSTFRILMPLFGEFFENVTSTQKQCDQKVEDATVLFVSKNELANILDGIQEDCMDSFTGFIMEVVNTIDDTTGYEPRELLDIIVGGVRVPVDMPMKCVANELTSMYPSIMIASGEIETRIKMAINDNF